MNIIKTLRENNELANVLDNICDIRILPELVSPSDAYGRLTFNIKGKVFLKMHRVVNILFLTMVLLDSMAVREKMAE